MLKYLQQNSKLKTLALGLNPIGFMTHSCMNIFLFWIFLCIHTHICVCKKVVLKNNLKDHLTGTHGSIPSTKETWGIRLNVIL